MGERNYLVILRNVIGINYLAAGRMKNGIKHGISTEIFEDRTSHQVMHNYGHFIKNL